MLIEPLDPRRLFAIATTGLDPTFGRRGQATFAADFISDPPFALGGGSVFVTGSIGRLPYVVKLTGHGRIDPTFGDRGYARLPFRNDDLPSPDNDEDTVLYANSFAFGKIAYDAANSLLYVAVGRRSRYDDPLTVGLTRLRADGSVDPSYGHKGVFSYAPDRSAGDDAYAAASVEAINPLADGSVVLAVDRRIGTFDTPAEQNLALIKLRPKGVSDDGYGTYGVHQLLGGTIFPAYSDNTGPQIQPQTVRRAFFNEVTTDADGTTHVLMRYTAGTASFIDGNVGEADGEAVRGVFSIKSRVVTAVGVEMPSAAHSWQLREVSSPRFGPFVIQYAGTDGDSVRVLTTYGDHYAATATVYTLRPGRRPQSEPIDFPDYDKIFTFSRSANGQYLAHTNDMVARYKADFTLDRTFGVNGVARENFTIFLEGIHGTGLADDRGRYLVLDAYDRLNRFA